MLISLVVWVAISVPFALGLGRALRKPHVADEVETYLRGRRGQLGRVLRHTSSIIAAGGIGVGLVLLTTQAVQHLPTTAELSQSIGRQVTLGRPTTTTSPVAGQPAGHPTRTGRPVARHQAHRKTTSAVEPTRSSPVVEGGDVAVTDDPRRTDETTESPPTTAKPRDEPAAGDTSKRRPTGPSEAAPPIGPYDPSPGWDEPPPSTTTTTTRPPDSHDGRDGRDGGAESPPSGSTSTTSSSTTSTTSPPHDDDSHAGAGG